MSALSTALLALSLAGSAPAEGATFRLAWVDLLSEDSASWMNYDLPMLGATPGTVGMRYLYQVQPVWGLPVENLYLGTSIQAQTLHYERTMKVPIGPSDLGWYGGLQTRLLMPDGVIAGLRWKTTRVRLAAGASLVTPSTWRRPSFKTWSVLPSLGVSIVLGKPEPDRRFRSQPIDRPEMRMDQAAPTGEGAPMPTGEGAPMPTGEAAPMPTGEAAPMPTGEAAPTEVVLPESEVQTTVPTGPTAVQFTAPTQVVIPGSEPVQVELPEEPAEEGPTRVVMPGEDDSSQNGDK